MDRRDFLKTSSTCFAFLTFRTSPSFASTTASNDRRLRPNILWISCEDTSPDLGYYGDDYADTPNLDQLATDEVAIQILHAGVGGVNESDVTLALASKAPIIGFNVRANAAAKKLAQANDVEIRYYSVIYDLLDDLKAALSGLLAPTLREKIVANAQVLEVFDITKVGNIAGCRVMDGLVKKASLVRLLRDDTVIFEGKLSTLRRFKDDVREVKEGLECGMAFENYNDIRVGDIIEAYEIEEIARSL